MIFIRVAPLARLAVLILVAALAASTATAQMVLGERIEPGKITVGASARLTVAVPGTDLPAFAAPAVSGLDFVMVGDVRRVDSVQGVTTSTRSIIYRVTAREPGQYTIPALLPGTQAVVLKVDSTAGSTTPGPGGSVQPPPVADYLPADADTKLTADGTAFIRLRVPKRQLYVGESIPVDIQVGTRADLNASLSGMPTLTGDAFTLNQLSAQPQRSEETIEGREYSALTWHSVLAAVKPGEFSLTIETPLNIRMPVQPAITVFSGDENMDEMIDDPSHAFSGYAEREVLTKTRPTAFTVMALPLADRPADFSGAIGNFSVRSEVSEATAAAGDPLTLKLHILGTGNFDRVDSPMLHDVEHWRTYKPTAKFKAADDRGYQGEKTLEQPVVAAHAGPLRLPELTFSFFNPDTRRYEVARTASLDVNVTPPLREPPPLRSVAAPGGTLPTPAPAGVRVGLRSDHPLAGTPHLTLRPDYLAPVYLAVPSVLVLAFSGLWLLTRRRQTAAVRVPANAGSLAMRTRTLLDEMHAAGERGDGPAFFDRARRVLQAEYSRRWRVSPESVTRDVVAHRLGAVPEVSRVFELADEFNYGGAPAEALDYADWKRVVLGQIADG